MMQVPGSCNMTMSLVADDPNAYLVKMCSLATMVRCAPCACCTMLRLESAMAEQALSPVRNAGVPQHSPAIICPVMHHVVLAGFASTVLFPSMSSFLLCPSGKYGRCAVQMCWAAHVHTLLTSLLMLAVSNKQ